MKIINFILAALVALFIGCVSDSVDETLVNNIDNCEVSSLPELGLSYDDMISIGLLHNKYALRIQSKLTLNSDTEIQEIVDALTVLYNDELDRLNITDFPLSYQYVIEKSMDVNQELRSMEYDLRAWNICMLSSEGFSEFDKIFNALNDATDVQDINNIMDVLVSHYTTTNLTQYEKEILITSAEVARNSFELWAPESLGGLNLYDNIHSGIQLRAWSWRNAARGDVAGLATYFNGLAVTGIINAAWIPGANGAIAAGAAAAAVGGSIWGGIF